MKTNPKDPIDLDAQAQELVEMLDALISSGSGHIHLTVGEETTVQTVNSTDCSCGNQACAVPTFFDEDEDDSMDEDFTESDEDFE